MNSVIIMNEIDMDHINKTNLLLLSSKAGDLVP